MTPLLTKLRKITGWTLIIISLILMFISIFIATAGELLKGGGIYVASQLTWYPGLALLGPEIVQKSKDLWNNFKQKVKEFFR
jgi:membrane protease YdiL (CAAX protease family)